MKVILQLEMNVRRESRDLSVLNTDISVDRMIRRSMWNNDISALTIGRRVIRRVHIDSNVNTRPMPLFEHLDTQVYVITDINHNHNLASLNAIDDPEIVLISVPLRDLAILED
ncbi:hypothetical protein DMUE_6394 [Dictyocoela muelleri]|nr:hypothetical protein DMUE_6394 [Dictyocoela muelleri]